MAIIPLDNGFNLLFERGDKNLRLIISDGTTELACRKETTANLLHFLSSATNSLFKGRLQLHKHADVVAIILKGSAIGFIPIPAFKSLLNNL